MNANTDGGLCISWTQTREVKLSRGFWLCKYIYIHTVTFESLSDNSHLTVCESVCVCLTNCVSLQLRHLNLCSYESEEKRLKHIPRPPHHFFHTCLETSTQNSLSLTCSNVHTIVNLACHYLFPPPAEASQECQHQGAEASRARKSCHTAAKHGKDGQTQHQEGPLHYQVFLQRKRPLLIT